jgi:hypothetical protein
MGLKLLFHAIHVSFRMLASAKSNELKLGGD